MEFILHTTPAHISLAGLLILARDSVSGGGLQLVIFLLGHDELQSHVLAAGRPILILPVLPLHVPENRRDM